MKAKLLLAVGGLLLMVAGGVALFIYSGVYHVGATKPHSPLAHSILRMAMERSVRHHAKRIEVPHDVDLRDRGYATQFYGHYSAACVTCHSAPGVKADPWMVNYPASPNLTDPAVVNRWSDAELFWIAKHGIKDTAMIALGPTHKDKDIWGVTAIVRQLPGMSPAEYAAMGERFKAMKNAKSGNGQSSEGAAASEAATQPTQEQLEASRLQLEASRLQLEASRKQLEAAGAAQPQSPSPAPQQTPAKDGHDHDH
ncbi:MAG: cytochrome c [Chthoniobacterales bacterium]|nr:cytochrome c [Chthoniobacterales bacterium]